MDYKYRKDGMDELNDREHQIGRLAVLGDSILETLSGVYM